MAAARELGELHDPRALEALGSVALSDNVLLASSAISALGGYQPTVALPYLLRAAGQSSVSGVTALEQAARSLDRTVLAVARRVLDKGDVAAQVVALAIIADLGDSGDLPKLRTAAHSDPVYLAAAVSASCPHRYRTRRGASDRQDLNRSRDR
jgi:HEAT repeat protein